MIFGVMFLSIWLRGFRLCGFRKGVSVGRGGDLLGRYLFTYVWKSTPTSAADMTITASALAGSKTFLVGND